MRVFGLEGGELHHAFDVAGEFFQLLAHGGDGLLVKPLAAMGFGDEVKRLWLNLLSAPVERAGERPGDEGAEGRRPHHAQDAGGK